MVTHRRSRKASHFLCPSASPLIRDPAVPAQPRQVPLVALSGIAFGLWAWLWERTPSPGGVQNMFGGPCVPPGGYPFRGDHSLAYACTCAWTRRLTRSCWETAALFPCRPVSRGDERWKPMASSRPCDLQQWSWANLRGGTIHSLFDKAYAYSIRHMYGKEGKRTDYTPYSCMKIILSNPPGQGDYHGCPFRHCDPELLKQKLQSYKVSQAGISQIMELVKGMHYQLACQKFFELSHNIEDAGFSLNHPNQYFVERPEAADGGEGGKEGGGRPLGRAECPSAQDPRRTAGQTWQPHAGQTLANNRASSGPKSQRTWTLCFRMTDRAPASLRHRRPFV
ncbi:hypothetical protein SKAU_G00221300 [Synaphobranchus kaupii]|uniref:DNA primase large subunit C-terminal domain-containing protein n=1 Tax=Synaphobranchus kaupii TaxID=118154 RepID=A0A9Q1FAV0_SYNKA|nr:hypothetical protein SKAU_G00221300 [Synaphobranchus kaupii]